ncbi:hypothetical protein MTO96_042289 [Rhipicephalus appendiculatus]
MMRAIRVSKLGGPQVLQLSEKVPIPEVEPRKVLIRVKAAGVNPVDTYIREGHFAYSFPLPYTPGKDGAGVVEEVGEGVTNVKRGERVFFSNRDTKNTHGSYAQYCLMNDTDVWRLPERMSFEKGRRPRHPLLHLLTGRSCSRPKHSPPTASWFMAQADRWARPPFRSPNIWWAAVLLAQRERATAWSS